MHLKNRKIVFKACLIILLLSLMVYFVTSCADSEPPSITEAPSDTQPDTRPTIIIDAGHGGEDGGTVGVDGTLEKDINLALALELDELLRANGFKTRLTRSEDILLYDRNSDYYGHKKEQDMAARLKIVNEYDNAIFISLHMNSFSQAKYKGLQVYYSENSPASYSLAGKIQALTAEHLQSDNTRKIKPSAGNIYLLEKINHPAVLVECGFLSNAEDCENLKDKEYRGRLCTLIYYALSEQVAS